MSDSLNEIEFELSRHTSQVNAQQMISMMKDGLKMGLHALEFGNARCGPFLSLDGWASAATSDMSKYDQALMRLYKLYFRKTQMSPIMELGYAIVSSALAFHFKNKFFGGFAQQPTPPVTKPIPKQIPKATRPETRPVLNPPKNLFS